MAENVTMDIQSQMMSTPVVAVMRTIGVTIVLLNVTVIVILVVKKRKFPEVYWLQIVCLALNDCLAGLAVFLISFIDEEVIRSSVSYCCIIVTFLYASQSASLYNIFGISVHRFVLMKRYYIITKRWRHRHTVVSTVVGWGLSAFLCSLPIFLYSKPDLYNKIKFCSLVPIFGKDIRTSTLILMGSFCLPLMFINIVYTVLFYKLSATWKTIQPGRDKTHVEDGSLCSDSAVLNNTPSSKNPCQVSTNATTSKPPTLSTNEDRTTKRMIMSRKQRSLFLQIPVTSSVKLLSVSKTENSLKSKSGVSSDASVQKDLPKEPCTSLVGNSGSSNNDVLDASSARHSCAGKESAQKSVDLPVVNHSLMRQRKVFTLLGVILLFLNIFSWPGVIALLLTSMVHSISLNRETLLPLFTTICFNSVVNPVLYTATITEFRAALVEIFYSVFKKGSRNAAQ